MAQLPEAFADKMRGLLGPQTTAFFESYEQERSAGLRVNTLMTDVKGFLERRYFHLTQIPWTPEGFYYPASERPGRHPCHEAGVYYIQEPSAMAVVELLDPRPGEYVLDLCAAPGGKTTQIAARLAGQGLLLCNEIHPARAKILSQNVERMGAGNVVVVNEEPRALALRFQEYFDRILVDAPCSGEGMFRKDEDARLQWSPDHVIMCAARQQEILHQAASMLRPGGRLVYSTCTFSPEEDEGSVEAFLRGHEEFSVEAVAPLPGLSAGRPEWVEGGREELSGTFRIWPHLAAGEGHYMAVLRKAGDHKRREAVKRPSCVSDPKVLEDFFSFCQDTLKKPRSWKEEKIYLFFGEQLYLIPEGMGDMNGLRVLRPGLHLGSFKKKRFEPSHAFARWLRPEEVIRRHDMDSGSQETVRYLRGEAQSGGDHTGKGWTLMCVDGYSLGWAKAAGGMLKNHYPKGLRWM